MGYLQDDQGRSSSLRLHGSDARGVVLMVQAVEQKPKAAQVIHFSCDLPIPLAPYCRPMLMGNVQTTTHRREVTCQACLQKLRSWRPPAVMIALLVVLGGFLGSGTVLAEHRPDMARSLL